MLGKCLALGDPGAAACRQRSCARCSRPCSPARWTTPARELEALRPQLQAYEARGLDDPQPGFSPLLRVLLETWSAPELDTTPLVSSVLTRACLRPDHLWRDLGLSGREDVTALLTRHYPGLAARNVRNLRWKQYLAYAACEHAGLPPAAAPGCPAGTMNIATAARRPDCAARRPSRWRAATGADPARRRESVLIPAMDTTQDIERRLTELEIKASFADDMLEQLNQIIVRQQQQMERLARELADLRQQQRQAPPSAACATNCRRTTDRRFRRARATLRPAGRSRPAHPAPIPRLSAHQLACPVACARPGRHR